ncbi:MAG TPA: NuoI/complex I 23 kDa subunit family protein [Candidatus Hypogeohydataceae bacterium YC38]|nr:NADH-quinone oxidoreductase subunit I [Candidatus Brocadiales bacterium]
MKIVGHKLSFLENIYLFEIVRGLVITTRHFFYNMFFHIAHLLGYQQDVEAAVTIQYPEQTIPVSKRWRGVHRINTRPDGSPRCVACMLCETVCPVQCIHIVAEEHPDPAIEKYPVSFEVDVTRCCWCGMCEEACPVDAIYMDSGKIPKAGYSRQDLVYDKETLTKEVPLPGYQRSLNPPGAGAPKVNPMGL